MTAADISLNGLKHTSQWLRYYAKDMQGYVASLGTMPDFETLAEAELEDAELALKSALEKVRNVRANIRPVRHLQAAE